MKLLTINCNPLFDHSKSSENHYFCLAGVYNLSKNSESYCNCIDESIQYVSNNKIPKTALNYFFSHLIDPERESLKRNR